MHRGTVGGAVNLLIQPVFHWFIGKVEVQQARKKTAEERDWMLSELLEDWREFIYEHTNP